MPKDKSIADKYSLLGLVGAGQYGRVFCARHRQSGKLVALKELPLARFPTHNLLRELRYLLTLNHVNITRCETLEHSREGRYLVLEYCEGGTLRDLINPITSSPRFTPLEIVSFLRQILDGLGHAHAQGVVHCDVKPENILLKPTAGGGWILKITDFGIARPQTLRQEEISATGSAAYMAPERFYGQFSPASDLYAVGIILYELLTGVRPFSGSPSQLMHLHLNQRPVLDPDIPALFRPILTQALQKLPGRRYPTAHQMQQALDSLAETCSSGKPLPASCWVGPLLPCFTPLVRQSFQIGMDPDCWAASPSPLEPVLTWSCGAWLYRSSGQHHYQMELAEPILKLHQMGRDCVVVTAQTVQLLTAEGTLLSLLSFAQPWSYGFYPARSADAGSELLWATPTDLGRVDFPDPSLPGLSPLALTQERSFYRWSFPQALQGLGGLWGTPDGLMLMEAQPSQTVLRILARDSPCQATDCYVLPWTVRQGVVGSTQKVLLVRDAHERLWWIQVHPFRIKRIALPQPPLHLWSTAWGFGVTLAQGILFGFWENGEGWGRIQLPPHSRLLTIDPDGHLWIRSQSGWIQQLDGSGFAPGTGQVVPDLFS